ncbi:multiple epidermal growth factor-like domains protein 10 isoform X2 [Ambystoma mexicanum]|uniref:multiple epidermal growth factor-like domains protein 10 isoform X2 n=1 Tax=Ambystoma mexicanum TaxID=8296 RepID=UPI0037E9A8AB
MKASAVSTLALALGLLCTVQARLIISSEKRGECPQRISWCDRPPPYNHTCNNDYDCGGTQKCCIEVCIKECRNIVPVKLKPGMCPEDPRGCHMIEDDECYGDNHCPGDQKCCVFHCGLKCKNTTTAAAVKPKPGMCPEDPRGCHLLEKDECYGDNHCPGDQKCCVFHCGLKCKNVMKAAAAPEKSGSCPLPPMFPVCIFPAPPWNQCATDQECQDDQKCCDAGCSPQCRKPLQDKSGHCPPFKSSICKTDRPYPGTCSSDSQCEGTERCCCLGNGRMECTATVKPGTCPAAKLPCTDYSTPDNCTDDGDCQGRQKCCEGCGKHKRCRSPDPVKPGACPDIKASCLLPLPKAECKDDLDCGGLKKCCKLCGNQCMNPASVRPGFCPIDLMLEPQCGRVLRNNCTSDGDCGDGEKCCLFGCGMQCVMALDVAPGSCPGMKAKCDPEKLARECKADNDCDPKEKCCELCGNRCLAAVSDHAGFCPVSRFHILILCTPNNTVVNCSHDLDCPPDKKCCTSVCKTGCVKPLQEKTGECPAAKPDQPTAYEPSDICNKCNDDKDCTGDFKCCPGSKGKKCIQPMIIV